MNIIRIVLLFLFVSTSSALAQTTPLSTYVLGLAPASPINLTEKMVAVQTGVAKTLTPLQILAAVIGDCTMASPPSIICTKTNSIAFAPSATTDTTNASNISSRTLNLARLSLASVGFYVGNVSNNPAAVNMSGDCGLANTGAVNCTKTGGVTFAASATTAAIPLDLCYCRPNRRVGAFQTSSPARS